MNYSPERQRQLKAFAHLLDVLDRLRVECPWDRKQTNDSLRINTVEEVYELSEALLADDADEIKKELGDVLLHICFYAKIAQEQHRFDIGDVAQAIADKLIFRHPHIYGNVQADTAEAVEKNWEQIKLKEKGGNKTVLSGVPSSLPSMVKAIRIQDKARGVGFDWAEREDVWAKVREEISELQEAISRHDQQEMEEEFGDALFSLINAARLYKVNADNALEKTNRKFIQRFAYIEEQANAQGKELKNMTLEEMEYLWQEAKSKLKQPE